MRSMIKAVVFDMDGVLFDTERMSIECWQEIGKQDSMENIEEGAYGCMGLNRTDAYRFLRTLYGEDFPAEAFFERTHEAFEKRLQEEGVPLMKGVRELLGFLREQNYRIAIASSTKKEGVLHHIREAGIEEYFDVIISGDMVKHSKPQPDIYLKACEELGVAPEEAIAIEDSFNGIRSAYRAGMKPVMVPDMVEPTKEIEEMLWKKCTSLLEVMELLRG